MFIQPVPDKVDVANPSLSSLSTEASPHVTSDSHFLDLKLRLSPSESTSSSKSTNGSIQLEIAFREVEFVTKLASELLPLIAPPPHAEASASDISCQAYQDSVDVQATLSTLQLASTASYSSSSHISRSNVTLMLHLELTIDGVELILFDDSQTNTLPLFQLTLDQLATRAMLKFGSSNASREEGLLEVIGHLDLKMGARHFNPLNGAWEPVIEKWMMEADPEIDAITPKINLKIKAQQPLQVRAYERDAFDVW